MISLDAHWSVDRYFVYKNMLECVVVWLLTYLALVQGLTYTDRKCPLKRQFLQSPLCHLVRVFEFGATTQLFVVSRFRIGCKGSNSARSFPAVLIETRLTLVCYARGLRGLGS